MFGIVPPGLSWVCVVSSIEMKDSDVLTVCRTSDDAFGDDNSCPVAPPRSLSTAIIDSHAKKQACDFELNQSQKYARSFTHTQVSKNNVKYYLTEWGNSFHTTCTCT